MGLLGPCGPNWMAVSSYQIRRLPSSSNCDRGARILFGLVVVVVVVRGVGVVVVSVSGVVVGGDHERDTTDNNKNWSFLNT